MHSSREIQILARRVYISTIRYFPSQLDFLQFNSKFSCDYFFHAGILDSKLENNIIAE